MAGIKDVRIQVPCTRSWRDQVMSRARQLNIHLSEYVRIAVDHLEDEMSIHEIKDMHEEIERNELERLQEKYKDKKTSC